MRATLKAERSRHLEEVAHTKFDIARGSHILAQTAIVIDLDRAPRTIDHVDCTFSILGSEVDDLQAVINAFTCARHQIDVEPDVADLERHIL